VQGTVAGSTRPDVGRGGFARRVRCRLHHRHHDPEHVRSTSRPSFNNQRNLHQNRRTCSNHLSGAGAHSRDATYRQATVAGATRDTVVRLA